MLLGVLDVYFDLGPALGFVAPMRKRMGLQARLDRKQAQAGRMCGVIAQLGRAHRRAPCARRHDAATVAGKEDRVDPEYFPRDVAHCEVEIVQIAHAQFFGALADLPENLREERRHGVGV